MAAVGGFTELQRTLDRLEDKVTRKGLAAALRAAGKPIRKDAKARVPKGKTGKLKRSIRLRVRVRGKGDIDARVFTDKTAPHAHLVEFGHLVTRRKGGPVVGHAAPHPFLRPAFDANKERALTAFGDEIWRQIREVK